MRSISCQIASILKLVKYFRRCSVYSIFMSSVMSSDESLTGGKDKSDASSMLGDLRSEIISTGAVL